MRRAVVVLCGVLAVLYLLVLVFVPTLRRLNEMARRSNCNNNLRHLALGAIQYADDRRYFPHVRGAQELDGGIDTSDGPAAIGKLVRAGYSGGYGLTCAATPDEPPPMVEEGPPDTAAARAARWSYSGVPGEPDPVLAETRNLSFGWTRRALPSNSRSTRLLLGDRAVLGPGVERLAGDDPLQGNHQGFMYAQADGTVSWIGVDDPGLDRVAATELPGDGALGVLDPSTPRPKPPFRWRWAGWSTPGLSFAPLGLLGLVAALALRRREPAPPPGPGVRPVRPSRVRELGPDERAVLGKADPADVVTLQPGQRCPVCRDDLEGKAEPLTACPACRATFHAACVAPGAPCSTLGCAHGRTKSA